MPSPRFQAVPLEQRFWPKVEKTETCWLWRGYVKPSGYGMVRYGDRMHPAHRVALLLHGVTVPDGMETDHLCRVRHCVRPDHLEVVDRRTNQLRGVGFCAVNAKKTTCPNGHPYDYEKPNGWRDCRICKHARWRKMWGRRRAELQADRRRRDAKRRAALDAAKGQR